MDGHDLLEATRGMTEFEPVGDSPQQERAPRSHRGPVDLSGCVAHVTAGSRQMAVLKTMTTTACERGCFYCPFRAGRTQMKRRTISPDDIASGFMALYRKRAVEGLFLSSGIIRGGITSQDKIIDTATILREKYKFRGFIHLKIMPGAERDQVRAAMKLANRVSINLEAPNADRLERLAPGKWFADELLTRLKWIEELRQQSGGGLRSSSVTQFVVGPAGERDVELLSTTGMLYSQLKLARVYFSAFSPVIDTPLDNAAPTDPVRELRLYQASFLLRDYGFETEELPFAADGDLPLNQDPKQIWAEQNLSETPVEVNTASPQELVRVPGIGVKSAERIVAARRESPLRDLSALRAVGVVNATRAAPYVLLDGHRPARQMPLL
ncbi:MAG TPA: radical SAM protein [Aggregatilinea sp.]|uniref:radical SAM protein n=1 Tax=Aggregatilinea sp. TaxID=2806333 RepID=UPI002B8FB6AF|nr:helix-hairpin-helix domain-containing protein [Aggregatilinea sp.]HML24240.1 radical SAM protein [Aggregatilinea sp.]